MNEEAFNMSMRKFLKRVGIGSQRHIEEVVRSGLDEGSISASTSSINVEMKLRIEGVADELAFEGTIDLT